MKRIFSILIISILMGAVFSQKTQAKVKSAGGETSCKSSAGICALIKDTPYGDITYYGRLTVIY